MDNLVSRLGEYVALESPTGDAAAIRVFTARLAADFAALGASVEVVGHPTGDHLVLRFPGTGTSAEAAPLLVLAHSDTVWPVGTLTTMPWRVDGERAFGPGCFDMKGGIVALHGALASLAGDDRPRRPVTVLVTADEEIGSPSSRDLIERHARTAHAALGLEPSHPDGALKTARWGSTRVRLEVTGREAHAALDPEAGASAIDELVDQLTALRTLVDDPGVLCNVGTIAGGGRTNVVPGRAHADIGLRFLDADTEWRVLAAIRDLTPLRDGTDVTMTVLSNRPAWTPGKQHDGLCAAIARAALTVGQTVDGRPASGAADTNVTGWLGIPSVDGLGPVGEGAHAAHEQIVVASLGERAALIAAAIVELSRHD
jgi:glutamate carboxypeptidase